MEPLETNQTPTKKPHFFFQLSLNNKDPVQELTQLHYTGWPDFGVPANTKDLLTLSKIKMDYCKKLVAGGGPKNGATTSHGPVVVHCSTGCGRTGILVGLDTITKQIDAGNENPVDIYKCVLRMREDRGFMVMNEHTLLNW